MDKIMKNKKGLELVTCFLELQKMFRKINFLSGPFNLETGEKSKKKQKTEYFKNEKCLLEVIKGIFHNFEMLFFGKI